MNVLIFEDEKHTANRLIQLLKEIDGNIHIEAVIGSIKEGIEWFRSHPMPDLIFQDIRLRDGICFELYNAVEVTAPVIFTTAYSEYAIRSFQVNSIDYIVKPYSKGDIVNALEKFKRVKLAFDPPEKKLLEEILSRNSFTPRRRFLIKNGDNYVIIKSEEIARFISEESVTTAVLFDGRNFIVDYSISDLAKQMDKTAFLQINRSCIVNIESVEKISSWFNSRLKLQLTPTSGKEVIVSRERVKDFKKWLDM